MGFVFALQPAYSVMTPFELTFSGAQGENYIVWEIENAAFELAALVIRCSVAMDLNVCDSSPAIPIGFLQLVPGSYLPLHLGGGRVRSAAYSNSKLILLDPVGGAVVRVKGIAYGYEVMRDGFYR